MSVVKRAAALVVALVALATAATPAAGQTSPPGLDGDALQPGEWVALTFGGPTLTAPRGSTTWGPVTVTMQTSPGLDTATLFASWGQPVESPQGWPEQLSSGGVSLTRVSYCDATAQQCSYTVSGTSGSWFMAAGTSGPVPDLDFLLQFEETVTLVPPLPASISISVPSTLSPSPAQGSTPGTVTLDASGTTDGSSDPDAELAYDWTLTGSDSAAGVVLTASGKVVTIPVPKDGNYTLRLKVTSLVDGHSDEVEGGVFSITGVEPVATPGPGNGSGGGGGGGAAPAPAPGPPQGVDPGVAEPVVFAAPRRNVPPALFGGQSGEAQVVWLWRPEWAGTPTGPRSPRTSAPPIIERRDDIFVGDQSPAPDSNAAPWLAGIVVFGLFGTGWVLTRRRRVRAEL